MIAGLSIEFRLDASGFIDAVYIHSGARSELVHSSARSSYTEIFTKVLSGECPSFPFPFTLSNTCFYSPGRIIIYSEQERCVRGPGEALLRAYSYLAARLDLPVHRIDYTRTLFTDFLRSQGLADLSYRAFPYDQEAPSLLFFGTDTVYDSLSEPSVPGTLPDALLLFPIVFKRAGNFYAAYNPSFSPCPGPSDGIGFANPEAELHSPSDRDAILPYSMYPVLAGNAFWNLDAERLNLFIGD